MSRVAKAPVVVPAGVDVKINGQVITIKGKNGELTRTLNDAVEVKHADNTLTFGPRDGYADGWAQAGTARALLNSMVIGVTEGFTKKLQLVGVGYRAAVKGNVINLSLGFSHPVDHQLPAGITAECPTQTEIVLKGADKQVIGQVAADLRAYRRPEPYKGKGVRYADEVVIAPNGSEVLVAASTVEKAIAEQLKYTGNKDAAAAVGKAVAERALEKGIKDVSFDRSGFQYHGRVQALADAAREAGLQF
ncbi:50S ribosomal protein L6 [Clonorchis sinensis]|nr:50S ribosomal protein L6 [Clonorchis sinensis]